VVLRDSEYIAVSLWCCIFLPFDLNVSLPTQTMSVSVGMIFESVCLSVFLFVVCPQHNSETNDPKVFKLDIRNDLEIYSK